MDFLLLLLLGFAGLFFHWLKKWSRGQTDAGFIDYMQANRKHSAGSVGTVIASIVSLYTLGDVALTNQTAATAFLLGFALDSAINKAPEQ